MWLAQSQSNQAEARRNRPTTSFYPLRHLQDSRAPRQPWACVAPVRPGSAPQRRSPCLPVLKVDMVPKKGLFADAWRMCLAAVDHCYG